MDAVVAGARNLHSWIDSATAYLRHSVGQARIAYRPRPSQAAHIWNRVVDPSR